MRYAKRLNNNVVVAVDDDGQELICSGRGLGFGMTTGEVVDEAAVEKVFVLQDPAVSRQLQQLLTTTPVLYVDLAERICGEARRRLTGSISDTVIVHLADHMHMAVDRHRRGLDIRNMMLLETQRFYAEEYRLGVYAVDLLNAEVDTDLPEDEAGFIALHLVGARLGADESGASLGKITAAIREIERIVRLHLMLDVDTDSIEYRRFLTHLKFFAERLVGPHPPRTDGVGAALQGISAAYPAAARCVDAIDEFLALSYGHALTPAERLYLTIHIAHLSGASH